MLCASRSCVSLCALLLASHSVASLCAVRFSQLCLSVCSPSVCALFSTRPLTSSAHARGHAVDYRIAATSKQHGRDKRGARGVGGRAGRFGGVRVRGARGGALGRARARKQSTPIEAPRRGASNDGSFALTFAFARGRGRDDGPPAVARAVMLASPLSWALIGTRAGVRVFSPTQPLRRERAHRRAAGI